MRSTEDGPVEPGASAEEISWRRSWVPIAILAAIILATRLFFVSGEIRGKDGPLYLEALQLDGSTYRVPPPGNLGFVLLARCFLGGGLGGVQAYAAANVSLTILGVGFTYGIALNLFRSTKLAFGVGAAVALSPLVWECGPSISSYLVWLAVLPAIAFFGLRFLSDNDRFDLFGLSISYGLGLFLRPDILVFGGPLWFYCWIRGRASISSRAWSLLPVLMGVLSWLLGNAWLLGSFSEYFGRVQQRTAFVNTFALTGSGWFEGLVRNSSKYGLFLVWTAPVAIVASLPGALRLFRSGPSGRRFLLCAAAWLIPSLTFSLFFFTGTAGLVFPAIPVICLLAAAASIEPVVGGLERLQERKLPWIAIAAVVSFLQFTLIPMLPLTNQRNVILNVMFFQRSAAGLRNQLPPNLTDYGMDESLSNVLRQLRNPEPVPKLP